MRVALNCYPPSTPTGLGTLCRTLSKLLSFSGKLYTPHPKFGGVGEACHPDDVDCVVAIERPMPAGLFSSCKATGKRTVLIVMHEWLNEGCEWIPYTDTFIAPNDYCERKLLYELKIPQSKVVRCNLPLDLVSLPFQERVKADTFVFSNGWGGTHDRKGWPEMAQALELLSPEVRKRVKLNSQTGLPGQWTKSLDLSTMLASNTQEIYSGIDVAVAPSRCEGLGLGILEPMVLGLPVLVTDAAPMNEYVLAAYKELTSLSLLPVSHTRTVHIWNHPVEQSFCCPKELASRLSTLSLDLGIGRTLSHRGRQWIEREMGESAVRELWRVITGVK